MNGDGFWEFVEDHLLEGIIILVLVTILGGLGLQLRCAVMSTPAPLPLVTEKP